MGGQEGLSRQSFSGAGQSPESIWDLDSLLALTRLPTPDNSLNLPNLPGSSLSVWASSSCAPELLQIGKDTLSSWVGPHILDVVLTPHMEVL